MINSIFFAALIFLAIALLVNFNWIVRQARSIKGKELTVAIAWGLMLLGSGVFWRKSSKIVALGNLDSSGKFQIILYGIAGLIIISVFFRSNAFSMVLHFPVAMLLIYGTSGLLSATYSPLPYLSAYKSGLIILDALLVAIAIRCSKDVQMGKVLYMVTIVIVILFSVGSLIGVFVRPYEAIRPSGGLFSFILDGAFPYMNANELGFNGAVTSFVGLRHILDSRNVKRKILWASILLIGILVLTFAQARTSVITFCIATFLLLFANKKHRRKLILGAVVAMSIFVTSLIVGQQTKSYESVKQSTKQYFEKGQSHDGLQSLQGRATMWREIGLKMISERPLIGYGFDAGVKVLADVHMHNSHFQIFANSGFFGYVFWFAMLMYVCIKVYLIGLPRNWGGKTPDNRFFIEFSGVFVLLLLRTFTGSVMVVHHVTLLIFLSIMVICYGNKVERKEVAFGRNRMNDLQYHGA